MPYKDLLVRRNFHRKYQRNYMPKWKQRNPDKARAIAKRYEKSTARAAAYSRRSKSDKRRTWDKKWRKEWRRKNLYKLAAKASRRRAVIRADSRFLRTVNRIYERAAELRQWFDVSVDHVTPLARGGLHKPSNLQIIYRAENQRKGVRLNFVPSVIFT